MDLVRLIIAILLPPLGVFLQVGLGGAFWLNIVMTLLAAFLGSFMLSGSLPSVSGFMIGHTPMESYHFRSRHSTDEELCLLIPLSPGVVP